jgi:OOP family OmpA-OmpF porin
MKTTPIINIIILSAIIILVMPACKAKKLASKPEVASVAPVTKPMAAVKQTADKPMEKVQPTVVEKPSFSFNKIQFDFDSAILKTSSIQVLDQAASLIKKYPGYHFALSGYASAEGTPEHNMVLSEERANSVKTYLVNAGIDAAYFTAKGYGDTNPVASNKTEAGRVANRRVEVSLAQ